MLREVKHVTCPCCGHRFLAFIAEDKATEKTAPVTCPACKTRLLPDSLIVVVLGAVIRWLRSR